MPHASEASTKLATRLTLLSSVNDIAHVCPSQKPEVWMLHFPANRTDADAAASSDIFRCLAAQLQKLHPQSTICILTSPPDAARLIPYLENVLHYKLWIAVKTPEAVHSVQEASLLERHAALLVFTRYPDALSHTKTRVQYTYCPACHKTTKDYGGKKHIYHEYGTLLSDVWRDIECDPNTNISAVVDRLTDLFGLPPYTTLNLIDLRACVELLPQHSSNAAAETKLPLEWGGNELPIGSRLINQDCLEALRSLPDNSMDFCFADPHYNIQKKYDHWNDAQEAVEYFAWCDAWLSELARVLKPGRTLAVVNIPLWAVRHYQYLASVLQFQTWIAWDALGLLVRMIMPSHYGILCFSKGVPRSLPGLMQSEPVSGQSEDLSPLAEFYCVRASCISRRRKRAPSDRAEVSNLWYDIHRLKHNTRRVDHPCQLPPMLMRRLFALFTRPGETILDCFNGAGTSTLVAQQMNRRFLGIELSPQYHELAA